jgi:hypothetical protein
LIELSLILDTRQFEAVNFFVLAQQRIPRRAKYRIPQNAAEATTAFADVVRVLAGRDLMQAKSLSGYGHGQRYQ